MPGVLQNLTTQKATAALGAAVVAPFVAPYLDRFTGGKPIGRIIAGVGLAYVGGAFLDGHAEALAVGAGVAMAATGVLGMFLRVEAPSA